MRAAARIRRVATGGAVRTVARLAREIWGEHYPPIIGREQVDYMVPRFQGPLAIRRGIAAGAAYSLLLRGRKAQGYLAVERDPDGRALFLSKLYVRKEARGLGLAKAALRHAEDLCRRRGLRSLWLTVNRRNAAAIAWYERMGFRKSGTVVKDIGKGFVMDDHRMTKRVPPAGSRGQRQNGRRCACPAAKARKRNRLRTKKGEL